MFVDDALLGNLNLLYFFLWHTEYNLFTSIARFENGRESLLTSRFHRAE